jgi:MSHA biogenesis protein MshP
MSTIQHFEQLYIALDQGYVQRPAFDHLQELADTVGGKLGGLIAYLKTSGFRGSKYRTGERGTQNPKPGTRSSKRGTQNSKRGTPQDGFSLPTAIFLLVVLWMLGAFIVSITGTQQLSFALDVQGTRSYQAARTGVEWAAFQSLDPNNTLPGDTLPSCPAPSTVLPALGGTLAGFTVTVTCTETTTTEGNRNVRTYLIVSTAVSGTPGSATYMERQLQAVLSKCKDPTADGPRFACG